MKMMMMMMMMVVVVVLVMVMVMVMMMTGPLRAYVQLSNDQAGKCSIDVQRAVVDVLMTTMG